MKNDMRNEAVRRINLDAKAVAVDMGDPRALSAALTVRPERAITLGAGRTVHVRAANVLVLLAEGLLPEPISRAVEDMFYGAETGGGEISPREAKRREFELYLRLAKAFLTDADAHDLSVAELKALGMKLLLSQYDAEESSMGERSPSPTDFGG